MIISCDDCARQNSSACDDCVVTFVLRASHPSAGGALVLDAAEARAVRLLGEAGLLPRLRHRRRPAPLRWPDASERTARHT